MSDIPRILIVEDGDEYVRLYRRFLADGWRWERAGHGAEALQRLAAEPFDAVVLDLRFDRVDDAQLLGDLAATADRFHGDPARARAFLQDHQGTYVLAALRDAGHGHPVLFVHDFGLEPRRWEHLRARYAPVDYLPDDAGPTDVAAQLTTLLRPSER